LLILFYFYSISNFKKTQKTEQEQDVDVSKLESNQKSKQSNVTSEKALKYICWMVDVDHLFNVALGM